MSFFSEYCKRPCLCALSAASLLFSACTEELQMEENVSRPSDCLSFTASIVSEQRPSSILRSSANIEEEQQNWTVQTAAGSEAATKGSLSVSLKGEAGVIGFNYNAGETPAPLSSEGGNIIEFEFNGDEMTSVGTPIRWNTIEKDSLDIFAYAPRQIKEHIAGQDYERLSVDPAYRPALYYKVPAAVADQKDIIVSKWRSPKETYKNSTIHLTFDHALTAVRFKVGFACTVKSVTISGVYNSGKYDFKKKEWTLVQSDGSESATAEYTINFEGGKTITSTIGGVLTDGENTLILMPQTLPVGSEGTEGAKIKVVIDEGGNDKTLTADIGGKIWEPGKLITYTLYKDKAPETVYFDLAAGDVNIDAATYSGFRYSNDGKEVVTVSGTHVSGTRYYVYQSSDGNRAGIWSEGGCIPPEYPEVKGPGGILWRDFITNNTDVESVIEAWDKYNETYVKNAGRSATDHRITILGAVTCELTIDNIYSTYQDPNPALRKTAGITFVPTRGQTNKNVKNAKVKVNVKGDNRVGAVHYHNRSDNGNAIIFEGTGSLTVADVDGKTVTSGSSGGSLAAGETGYWSNHWSSAIGGNDDTQEEICYGITINSGTIFAGTTKAENCTALGGGGNVFGEVIINGGTVTAVATSTGTAIGGGIGFAGTGGEGRVIITGGNVYAYNHKNEWNCPSSAIGGGSSIRSYAKGISDVEISGGYVYAESETGPAIGGGSSYSKQGSPISVTITGGEVIAKTKSKLSASIGGGTAFSSNGEDSGFSAESDTFDGGTATVRISGNPIIRTGSIGGGGTGDNDEVNPGHIGNASIEILGGDIQAQFILAAGTGATPSFKMKDGTIRNSDLGSDEFLTVKPYGGAIYLENGEISIEGGIISNCRAELGGAIYMHGTETSSFTMTGGTIQNNTSALNGGAVYIEGGTVKISGGTINNNLANAGNGGGIFIKGGSLTMQGTAEVKDNSAEAKSSGENLIGGSGGGVYVSSNTDNIEVNLLAGTVTGNSADEKGGGICVDMYYPEVQFDAEVKIGEGGAGPEISDNHTLMQGGGLYVRGSNSHITIDGGRIMGNTVSQYVYNPNVANELGTVTYNNGEVTHNVITFIANNGSDPEATATQNIVTSTNSRLVAPTTFHRTGYRIDSWNTKRSGRGESYSNNQIMNINSDITLYAQWVPDTN